MPAGRADLEADLKKKMRREMLMIVFGVTHWQSAP
jgi:hypothetical protein